MKQTLHLADLAFPESPRWHDDRLWVSDWGAQELITLDLAGKRDVVAQVRAFPFCTAFLPDGQPLVVAGNNLLRVTPDGSLEPYADLSVVSQGWNEIVADGRGNAYMGEATALRVNPGLLF